MASAPPPTHECPLCHKTGNAEATFQGSYDHDVSHLTLERRFYRCSDPDCGAVYFFDELLRQDPAPYWQEEREQEIRDAESRRIELQETDLYRLLVRAREENDPLVTKDREVMKQIKEMEGKMLKEQEELDAFPDRMRNFAWVEPTAIQEWVSERWLPPVFAEKSLSVNYGMSRPAIRKDIPDEELAQWRVGNPTYKEGQKVVHKAWGTGKVVQGNDDGGTIITAEFPKQGTKKMDLRFAKLEKAS